MPYNTRRKSLSLPSLGIHVPVTHAARAAAAAAASGRSTSTPVGDNRSSTPETPSPAEYPQPKRLKRSHDPEPAAARAHPATRIKYEHTPPPSSPESSPAPDTPAHGPRKASSKKDGSGPINDTIVEAVIAQLEATGNRPHLVKELAAVLAQRLTIVQHSANPCAIVSSRLASFLKRTSWTESSPCPIAKELEPVHPRRTYYFLTTSPRQPIPPQPLFFTLPKPAMTTPSITSDEESSFEEAIEEADESDISLDAEVETDLAARRALSPSPEVDLSSPEFDDVDDDLDCPPSLLSSHASLSLDRERRERGTSPPLERDEREFTQTANGLQKRKIGPETDEPVEPAALGVLDEGSKFDSLFYDYRANFGVTMMVSPSMKASPYVGGLKKDGDENWVKIGRLLDWDSTPETMELEELDCLLDAF